MADAAGPPPRGKNLVKVAEVAYAMKKRALEERDEADANAEKKQKTLTTIAKEVICPITHELPIKPVTAEDGKIYEEKAIREWFSKKDGDPTSPSTGAVIGTKLFPAPQARNTIEALIESGAIAGELAEAWTEKLELEEEVKEMLDQDKPFVYRFRVPRDRTVELVDEVLGEMSWSTDDIGGDFVIVRDTGVPMYNFVVVVDDAQMGITHVLRARLWPTAEAPRQPRTRMMQEAAPLRGAQSPTLELRLSMR